MEATRYMALASACAFACLALPAPASERMQAGQWEMTTTAPTGQTFTSSKCMTQAIADKANLDLKAMRADMEKTFAKSPCKVLDLSDHAGELKSTIACNGKETVATVSYHGDSSETVMSDGTKILAKRVGACK
jgi:hypothetical protein